MSSTCPGLNNTCLLQFYQRMSNDEINADFLWSRLEPKLQHLSDPDKWAVHSALNLAYDAHNGQVRKSGEPFITHPLEVTRILAELVSERVRSSCFPDISPRQQHLSQQALTPACPRYAPCHIIARLPDAYALRGSAEARASIQRLCLGLHTGELSTGRHSLSTGLQLQSACMQDTLVSRLDSLATGLHSLQVDTSRHVVDTSRHVSCSASTLNGAARALK